MKKLIPFLLATILLTTACLPQDTRVPQSPLLSVLERKSGLIAYLGADGNLYVDDQGGKNPTPVTDDALVPETQTAEFIFYQYPTWSQDSAQLAFVRAIGQGNEQTRSEMLVYNIDTEETEVIYTSATEHPFYLYWSPDNQHVSFLSTNATGQSIILQSVSVDDGKRVIVDAGSPYYWSWAPDGNTMIVHSGSASSSVPEHLAFLQVDLEIIEDGLDSTPGAFQAPAWSPDGSRILFTRVNDTQQELVLADSSGAIQKTLANFAINTAFAWSTDSELVAYIEGTQTPTSAGVVGTLHVLDLTTSEDFFQDENVFAFFWSPNSRKLAYFKPQLVQAEDGSQVLILELHMLDAISGESKELFTFRPTNQFSSILPYFDQYHQSTTIWSPDSNNLLLSFVDQDGNPGIAVVAASGQLEPRLLAQGLVAFWSWK